MSRKERSKPAVNSRRTIPGKPLRESFLIFCEGETEVGYFSAFRKRATLVKGGNALTRVQYAVDYKKRKATEKLIEHYWIVFDKDDETAVNFAKALKLAKDNNIKVAWSNQAFELWFILHYKDFSHGCHRDEYEKHLKAFITWYDKAGKGEKHGRQLYNETHSKIPTAIARAKKIFLRKAGPILYSDKHSSTKVYELVELLLQI